MINKFHFPISRLASAALFIAAMLFFSSGLKAQTVNDPKETIQKFATALQIIEFAYVDSINSPDLTETAIIEMLKKLDPHSAYISKEEVERVNEPLEGSFDGIGVTFQIFEDTIIVISPVPGGPSDKLGILAGDKIVAIEGESATGKTITNDYVMKRLRGQKGTTVTISVKRYGKKELIDFTIVRDKIPLNSIDAAFMVTPKIGLIKLTRFSKTSMEEFAESLAKLAEQGMKSLILDLRGNSGGYLDVAVKLSDEFLTDKKLIVYTEGLRSPRQDFDATNIGNFELGRLVVLINEGSASASEIVSGAVQDWDRGLIVGRRSFGKGLVQRPFKLPDNSMIRLTTARYHTPTGRCIQKPYEEGSDEYQQDFKHRLDNGEFVSADSIKFPDSLKYFTPGGRVVYGGGGIMPDIFTPIDSTRFSDYYTDLVRKSVFNNFVISYLDKNRNSILEKHPDLSSFKKDFEVDAEIYASFGKKATEEGVTRKPEDKYYYPDEKIKTQIKALIARNLWDMNAYFEVINQIDDELKTAISLIEDGKKFNELKLR
jgi:carboxyl-terminal processing protease